MRIAHMRWVADVHIFLLQIHCHLNENKYYYYWRLFIFGLTEAAIDVMLKKGLPTPKKSYDEATWGEIHKKTNSKYHLSNRSEQ